MIKLNYTANEFDFCVFNITELDNTQTSLVIHVDDMIVTASNESRVVDVIQQIETLYPGLTKHHGNFLNYIGMTFDFTKEGSIKMTIQEFVQDLIEGCKDMLGHLHNLPYSLYLTNVTHLYPITCVSVSILSSST